MNWITPSLLEEMGEFERVAELYSVPLSSLVSLFTSGTMEDMDDETWNELGNTDSQEPIELEAVFQLAAGLGRNAHVLVEAFRAGKPMKAPVVLFLANGEKHLVSGNTRLLVCRATGIRPRIFKLQSNF